MLTTGRRDYTTDVVYMLTPETLAVVSMLTAETFAVVYLLT